MYIYFSDNDRFIMGLTLYGITFGVPALSGDLFVNMFVMGLLQSPLQILVIYLMNRYHCHVLQT